MALTIFERQALTEYAEKYGVYFVKAVQKKKVPRRRTLPPARFSAPVNASGKLAKSYRYRISKDGLLSLTAAPYLFWLVQGRKPSEKPPPIKAIKKWMKAKGIKTDKESKYGASPYAIQKSIAKNGSSIYRRYKGQPSNLLNDIPLQELNEELFDKLGARYVETLNTQIVKAMNLALEDLNFEL